MKYYKAIALFLSLTWRDWHGYSIPISTSWEVSKLIWLKDNQ